MGVPGDPQDMVGVTQGGRRGGREREAGTDCTIVLSAGPHLWGTGQSQEPSRATTGCRQQVASTSGVGGGVSGAALVTSPRPPFHPDPIF